MSFEVSYISAASNQTPNAANWGKNNLICYCSCNVILIYDLNIGGGKITHTLSGHNGRVNAVCWIRGCEYETEAVSVASDNNVIVWNYKDGQYNSETLIGHSAVVNGVDALYTGSNKGAIIATSSADSTVKIWKRQTDKFELQETLNFGYNICLTLRLDVLSDANTVLLACALDRSNIELYVETENKFIKNASLKGHSDWVRSMDFKKINNEEFLLASSSQDALIRLWKFTLKENCVDDNIIKTPLGTYSISVESILAGHEGWIYSVNWCPKSIRLLSASLDKTMIIWEYNNEAKLWLESVRVGEVGGNTLGFYGGMFGPDGKYVMAHGYHGAFHIWKINDALNLWEPQVTIGGHFNEVVDLCWDPEGAFIMTLSTDQTTRIHAPWKRTESNKISWHEIARPQVHGYDMSCLALLGRYKFASGAEEKIIRTFQAPDNFIQNFKRICKIEGNDIECERINLSRTKFKKMFLVNNGPKGASVPSLGLSNKAVYENDNSEQSKVKGEKDIYPEESHFTAINLNEPPTEETLLQNTLWPEIQKLYGHGYEVYTLASSPDCRYLASACKSTTMEHAALLIWETRNWQIVQKLKSHTLTVVQIAFSPDSQHILSVSRDRRWSVFTKNHETEQFELAATSDKKTGIHSRIIWCCAWSHDSKYFLTGSRDGKLVGWWKNENKIKDNSLGQYENVGEVLTLKNESITAVDFAPNAFGEFYLVALGLENGHVYIYKWNKEKFIQFLLFDSSHAHHLTVKRLKFRPVLGRTGHDSKENENIIQLASCSSDNSLRLFDIII